LEISQANVRLVICLILRAMEVIVVQRNPEAADLNTNDFGREVFGEVVQKTLEILEIAIGLQSRL